MKRLKHWPAMGLVFACSCALVAGDATLSQGDATLARGVWGGDTIVLEVITEGAEVDMDCARGRIEGPIRVDGKGTFDLLGTYEAETPGPSRDDAKPASARYRGTIKGATMTLVISRADQPMGTFELTKDRRTVLRKCR